MGQRLEVKNTAKLVSDKLLDWWSSHRRAYPWRTTEDPYRLLIAEVMLHRTRADQVAKVYDGFVRHYPTVADLARGRRGDVLRILRPLGLRWRAKLMLDMARVIHEQYDDEIPRDFGSLISLPGVSDYIAAALQCFAFGVPASILDTNTVRVTGRVFGRRISDSSRRKKEFRSLYLSLQNPNRARDFNLAMIDLAALLCRPSHPKCHLCPISGECGYARSLNAS